jgi:hypothetical protein
MRRRADGGSQFGVCLAQWGANPGPVFSRVSFAFSYFSLSLSLFPIDDENLVLEHVRKIMIENIVH